MRGFSLVALLALLAPVSALAHHHGQGGGQNPPPVSPNPPQQEQPAQPGSVPPCLSQKGAPLSENNAQVLQWKTSTPNQYLDRGFVHGTLVQVLPQATGHLHLDVYLGQPGGTGGRDTDLEIIYNEDFGAVNAQLKPGMDVWACGDYITSSAQSGPYPASPLGAILHWVHKAMNGNHQSGFLMIDGQLYGQMNAAPRPGHPNDGNQGVVSY
jgi:hypothetical protein